jgi:hypothetical protein
MAEFLVANWQWVLLAFMGLEKIVKLTPTKYDDILLDAVLKPMVYRITGKKKPSESEE